MHILYIMYYIHHCVRSFLPKLWLCPHVLIIIFCNRGGFTKLTDEGWLPCRHETRSVTKFPPQRSGYISEYPTNTHTHISKNASIPLYTYYALYIYIYSYYTIRIPLVATWCPQPVIIVLGGGLMMSDERPPAICLFHHSKKKKKTHKCIIIIIIISYTRESTVQCTRIQCECATRFSLRQHDKLASHTAVSAEIQQNVNSI